MTKVSTSVDKMLAMATKLKFSEDELKELAETYSKAGEFDDEYRRSGGAIEPSGEDD